MKRLATLISIFFISVSTYAQNAAAAKTLLDEVSAKTKSYSNMVIDFSFNNGKEETSGKATIQGEKYVAEFMGITQIFDGAKTYIINPNDEEVTIASANSSETHAVSIGNLLSLYTNGYCYVCEYKQMIYG